MGSEDALGPRGRAFAVILAVGLALATASFAAANSGTEGELLTNEEQPRESYYWRTQDDYRVYYDRALGVHYGYEEAEDPVGNPGGSPCDAQDDFPNEGCKDIDGVCTWDQDDWWESGDDGTYHPEDFDHGRCAGLFLQERDGAAMLDARAAVDATIKTWDPACDPCEEVTGVWSWRIDVEWWEEDWTTIDNQTLWVADEAGEACTAPEELYGLAVYADCIWAPVEVDLSEHAPAEADGFAVDVVLTDDGETRQQAFFQCPGCLG